jgi:hypothetical protein
MPALQQIERDHYLSVADRYTVSANGFFKRQHGWLDL